MSDFVGKRLAQGSYEILSVLGTGGMATVYRARQRSMDREVAIKVIAGQIAANPDFITRFKREASVISKLEHPHILPVYDFGDEDGIVYLVMRLVDGGALDTRLRIGALPMAQASRMFTQIASALTYSHLRGIVHRDLKPNNILLDKTDNPYLMDFGIAKVIESDTHLTATGTIMGTPAYMAPEQWRAEDLDSRTDIYALGIMLYQMLTGTLPFKGDTPYALMYQHMDSTPPSPLVLRPNLPRSINAVLDKALAKRKEDRYSSADEFAAAVNAAISNTTTVPTFGTDMGTDALPDALHMGGTVVGTAVKPVTRPPSLVITTNPRMLIAARADETALVTDRLVERLRRSFGEANVTRALAATDTGAMSAENTVPPNTRGQHDALLVVIGPGWLSSMKAGERRLDDPTDPVRRDIEAALAAPKMIVIPLLINGARLPPPEALPPSMRGFAEREPFTLHSSDDFESDAKLLVKEIEDGTGKLGNRSTLIESAVSIAPATRPRLPVFVIPVAIVVILLVGFGLFEVVGLGGKGTSTPIPATFTQVVVFVGAAQPTDLPTVLPATTVPPTAIPILATQAVTSAPPTSAPTSIAAATVAATSVAPTSAPTEKPPTLPPTVAPPTLPPTTTPPTVPPTAPIAAAPTLPPTATFNGPVLAIFRSADAITFYVTGTTTVSLVGITIETDTTQGQHLKARLDQYPSFIGLPFTKLKPPLCFHLENKGQLEPPPIQCRQIAQGQLFTEKLTPANVIWYDEAAGEARPVNITRDGNSLGQCSATAVECDLPLVSS